MPVYFQRIASNHPQGIQLMSQSPPGQERERNQTWYHRLTSHENIKKRKKERQSFLQLIAIQIFLVGKQTRRIERFFSNVQEKFMVGQN